jgi:hypothetical protein
MSAERVTVRDKELWKEKEVTGMKSGKVDIHVGAPDPEP